MRTRRNYPTETPGSRLGTRLGVLLKQAAPNLYSSEIVSDDKPPYNKAVITDDNPYDYDLDRLERMVNRMYTSDTDALENVDIYLGGTPKELYLNKLTSNAPRLGPESKYENLKERERLKHDFPSQYFLRDYSDNVYDSYADTVHSFTADPGEIAGRLGTAIAMNNFDPESRDVSNLFLGVDPGYAAFMQNLGYDTAIKSNLAGGAELQEPWDTVGPDIEAILNSSVGGLFKKMRRRKKLAKSEEEYNMLLAEAAKRIKEKKANLPSKKVKVNKPDKNRPKLKTGQKSKDKSKK